jgi:hypothetical protein
MKLDVRTVQRVTQSPVNPKRWALDLSCGHEVWVTAKSKPKRMKAKCYRCPAVPEQEAAGTAPAPAAAVFRLTVRCTREPNLHAKILRISNHGREWISELAKILNGTSEFFMRKIGELSPVGKCCTCGAPVECEVVEELPK